VYVICQEAALRRPRRKFLETTKAQLEARYAKVGALLNRRYFTQ
jgi:hypothetical protein